MIQTISCKRIVSTECFGKAVEIELGLLTYHCNAWLKTSWTGSIVTMKIELANVAIFKANMEQMDLISCKYDERSINLADPMILAT